MPRRAMNKRLNNLEYRHKVCGDNRGQKLEHVTELCSGSFANFSQICFAKMIDLTNTRFDKILEMFVAPVLSTEQP